MAKEKKLINKKFIRILLISYAAILFLITFFRIFDNSFWADECYSIGLVRMSFSEMIRETGADVHPPLYYMILRCVCFLLGEKGYAFHLASVIPVGITWLFCVTKVYDKLGVCAAYLLASFIFFLDNAILFNVEVRMYSWANLFVLLSFYEMYEIIMENKNKNWIMFSVFSLAAAYTHYYALLAVAFLYVMLIVYEIWKKGHTWKKTALVCGAAVIGYLPWLINLLQAFGRTADNWWVEELPRFHWCIYYLFTSQISKVYVGIWGLALFALVYNTFIKKRCSYEFAFCIFAGLVSILGTIGVGEVVSILWRPMFQMKYVYVVAGIAWMTFGLLIEKLNNKYIYTTVILIITLAIGIPNSYRWIKKDMEYQAGTQVILDNTYDMKDDEVLMTNSEHLDWTILEYYYPDNERILVPKESENVEYSEADWLFWNKEIESLEECRVAEGYLGPYNYVYVYRMK